jgi:hypothetical protein
MILPTRREALPLGGGVLETCQVLGVESPRTVLPPAKASQLRLVSRDQSSTEQYVEWLKGKTACHSRASAIAKEPS